MQLVWLPGTTRARTGLAMRDHGPAAYSAFRALSAQTTLITSALTRRGTWLAMARKYTARSVSSHAPRRPILTARTIREAMARSRDATRMKSTHKEDMARRFKRRDKPAGAIFAAA